MRSPWLAASTNQVSGERRGLLMKRVRASTPRMPPWCEIDDRLEHRLERVAVDRSLDPVPRNASSLGRRDDLTRLVLGQTLRHLSQTIHHDAGSPVGGSMDRAQDLIPRLILPHIPHRARADHRHDRSRIGARRQRDDPGIGGAKADLPRSSAAAATGHPDVEEGHVGEMELGEIDRLARVLRGSRRGR